MTAQVSEELILEAKTTRMNFCPPIPNSPDIITKISEEEFHKAIKAGEIDGIISSTACWRGYIGTWEIKENSKDTVDIQWKDIEGNTTSEESFKYNVNDKQLTMNDVVYTQLPEKDEYISMFY